VARALLKLLKHQLQKHQHLKQKQVLSLWVELWRARLQILMVIMVIVEAAAAAAAVRPVTSGRAVFDMAGCAAAFDSFERSFICQSFELPF
jgi:hypothetical protein